MVVRRTRAWGPLRATATTGMEPSDELGAGVALEAEKLRFPQGWAPAPAVSAAMAAVGALLGEDG